MGATKQGLQACKAKIDATDVEFARTTSFFSFDETIQDPTASNNQMTKGMSAAGGIFFEFIRPSAIEKDCRVTSRARTNSRALKSQTIYNYIRAAEG